MQKFCALEFSGPQVHTVFVLELLQTHIKLPCRVVPRTFKSV